MSEAWTPGSRTICMEAGFADIASIWGAGSYDCTQSEAETLTGLAGKTPGQAGRLHDPNLSDFFTICVSNFSFSVSPNTLCRVPHKVKTRQLI
jgi:hypothetical protein